jgi:hypothetical protein
MGVVGVVKRRSSGGMGTTGLRFGKKVEKNKEVDMHQGV